MQSNEPGVSLEPRRLARGVPTLVLTRYHRLFPNKIIVPPSFLLPRCALALVGKARNAKIPGRMPSYPVLDLAK